MFECGMLCDASIQRLVTIGGLISPFDQHALQAASYDLHVDLTKPLTLVKNRFYLLSTTETLRVPTNIRAQIHGRSSLGRMAVLVHYTAGFADPGFTGRITLEVMQQAHEAEMPDGSVDDFGPLTLEPGDRIAQVDFMWLDYLASRPYAGRYQNQYKATPSGFRHGDG